MPGTRSENPDGTVITRFATTPTISIGFADFGITDSPQNLPVEDEKVIKALENYLQVPYVTPKLAPFPVFIKGLRSLKEGDAIIDIESLFDVYKYIRIFVWFLYVAPPKWCSNIWLITGLAEYYTHLVFVSFYQEQTKIGVNVPYLVLHRLSQEMNESPPLMQYVEDPDSLRDMFESSIIGKSPFVVRMMCGALTAASFNKVVTDFLRRSVYNDEGVDEGDFFDSLDRAAKEDGTLAHNLSVKEIFSSWSHQAGYPTLKVTRNYENGSITISQERCTDSHDHSKENDSTTWWIPYNFATSKSPSFTDTRPSKWLPQHQRSKLIEPSGNDSWSTTDWVLFNKQQTGFYRVLYDISNYELLFAEMRSGPNNKIHHLNRDQLCDDLTFFVMNGRLPRSLLLGMLEYVHTLAEMSMQMESVAQQASNFLWPGRGGFKVVSQFEIELPHENFDDWLMKYT